MSRDCGGQGLCGKCRVQTPDLPVLEADRRVLGDTLCARGWRLGCQHAVRPDTADGDEMAQAHIAGTGVTEGTGSTPRLAALDIGTTTVVLALLDDAGTVVKELAWGNPQQAWGADVLSHIDHFASMPPDLIRTLIEPHLQGIDRLVITGNTVMTHLWLGTDPTPLAQVPFTIPHPDPVITHQGSRQEIVCAPFAPYVGADIRTGLQEVLAADHAESFLYMDLGTNGELAWYDRGTLTLCSTACGPALEGAGISIGMAALPEALVHVYHEQDRWHGHTAGDVPAQGVCGSGLISWIDALRQADLVTPAGKLKGCPPVEGLQLTQKDIRMFQLAKGALQAGWQLLVPDPAQVEEVWIAGGFSLGLNADTCIRLGLFHPAWRGKIRFCGNMALKGACRQVMAEDAMPGDELTARVLELEKDTRFPLAFARAMSLQEAAA
ncbi:ASKHA domain-containing protein [Faecalibaculum rodentium]|uniref:ASKHA domain-containing protein n=1 Tax=Faecalibaculum rodentium TaxID=1702221 RepID=UPI0023F24561|nr:ASKHA domain-containing protein [Faecalibaculum rodentium]